MILALILFAIMYVLLLSFSKYRYLIALATACLFIAFHLLPVMTAITSINWNIIMMLTGTMMVVELFIQSGMPAWIAEILLKFVSNVKGAVIVLSLFAGLISAFVDNVATVLMLAPVGLAVANKIKTNPVPVIIAIAVSSNLQGAATLVGDTTSILLGNYANMTFNDFFWFHQKPGISFAVELGALTTIPVMLFLFRKEKEKVISEVTTVVNDYIPSILMVSIILGLIIASQFENKPELTNGVICMTIAIFGIIYEIIRHKDMNVLQSVLKSIDYETLLLLAGLFMVIQGITEVGVIDAIVEIFVLFGGSNIFLMYSLIVIVSVIISMFVDNIPYVATMLPVVTGIATIMNIEPYLFDFGLLIGATLGGNLTPIGASANITAIGILRKAGYEVSSKDFLRIGVPFTLGAVLIGYVTIWLLWA